MDVSKDIRMEPQRDYKRWERMADIRVKVTDKIQKLFPFQSFIHNLH